MYCIRLRICNETKALNGYKDELKPMFKSTPTQFQTTIYASSDETEIEDVPKVVPKVVPKDVPKGDTQSGTQGDTQDVPQDVPEEGNLDSWIEEQIFQNPNY